MTITLDIPEDTFSTLRLAAQAQGKEATDFLLERVKAWYVPDPLYSHEGSEEELAAIGESLRDVAEGRVHPFDPDAVLRRYGPPPIS